MWTKIVQCSCNKNIFAKFYLMIKFIDWQHSKKKNYEKINSLRSDKCLWNDTRTNAHAFGLIKS